VIFACVQVSTELFDSSTGQGTVDVANRRDRSVVDFGKPSVRLSQTERVGVSDTASKSLAVFTERCCCELDNSTALEGGDDLLPRRRCDVVRFVDEQLLDEVDQRLVCFFAASTECSGRGNYNTSPV